MEQRVTMGRRQASSQTASADVTFFSGKRRFACRFAHVAVLGCAVAWAVAPAYGQFAIPARTGTTDAKDDAENIFPAPDRPTLLKMNRARELLKEAHYGEALESLGDILKAPDDYFFQPDKKLPVHRSLKAEARRLIGEMPQEGRDLYELKWGPAASDLLGKAVAAGDPARLAEVSGRYFHTQAGYEATFLLGLYHLDRGSPLAAALTLKRLREAPTDVSRFEPALSLALAAAWLEAGANDDARNTLVALKARDPRQTLTIAGRQISWFDKDADALPWLTKAVGPRHVLPAVEADRWLMARGDPARNAVTIGSAPLLNLRWRVPVSTDPGGEAVLAQAQQHYQERGQPLLSALQPLAVDNFVLMRTTRNLLAIDFTSGKRLWEVPTEEAPNNAANNNAQIAMFGRIQTTGPAVQAQRVWDDATYGTLTSDGRYVYSIEDVKGSAAVTPAMRRMILMQGGMFGVNGNELGSGNGLAAHDIRTGKLAWELGLPPPPGSPPRRERAYLGPPLPLRGQLYVLAETNDEIELLALDPNAKGKDIWSQQLAVIEHEAYQEPLRRVMGACPSYSDGILVCPTAAGAVAAVDLATRSLLWGYCYSYEHLGNRGMQQRAFLMATRFNNGNGMVPRWLDSAPVIVGGRVLITPAEADALYCLNLVDGKPLWPAVPRHDDLYLACVHHDVIVLVGRHTVRGIRLSDGKPAWDGRTITLPHGALPSGRGFYAGNQYFVPLSSAEVAAIDLDNGQIARIAKSRKGNVPGNLVCYQGRVISQGLENVEAFYQVDAAREEIRQRLAGRPEDAAALTLRGEMFLDDGRRNEALADLRRSYELDHDARTRDLLRDASLDALRDEFAGYRGRAAEIEGLLDDATQRAAFLRIMATGFQSAGEHRQAFDQYMKLLALEEESPPLDRVGQSISVRRDRWIQVRLAELRHAAGPEAAKAIDEAVQAQFKTAVAAKGPDALRRFLNYFAGQPAAADARKELLARLIKAGSLLEVELSLWPSTSATPAEAATAMAQLAEVFARADRAEDAAACYRHLLVHYADQHCQDGRTARQLTDALPADSPVRRALQPAVAWPKGKVLAEKRASAPNVRMDGYGRFLLQYRTNPEPFYNDVFVRFDQNRQQLIGYNSLGLTAWDARLEAMQRYGGYYNGNMTQASIQGHLLVMAMGQRILCVDPQAISGRDRKVLWTQDLQDATVDSNSNGRIVIQGGGVLVLGGGIAFAQQQFPDAMNTLGPVTSRYVCFQRFRNVIAADPLTGQPLWIRHNVPSKSELFGDDQYVFVVPSDPSAADTGDDPFASPTVIVDSNGAGKQPNMVEALVLRASDGQLLGRRRVPRGNPISYGNTDGLERSIYSSFQASGLTTFGRNLLTWQRDKDKDGKEQRVLAFRDPWENRDLWPVRTFAAESLACLVGREAVGVLEPDGHFLLLAIPDGQTIAEVKLPAEPKWTEIFAIRSGDQYFLMTHDARLRPGVPQATVQPIPGSLFHPVRRGRLYAIDLKGKLCWPAPAVITDQHFLVQQAADVPVLTCACQMYRPNLIGPMTVQVAVLAIDKRTGRVVLDDKATNSSMSFDVVADPQRKVVSLRIPPGDIQLKYTDDPWPAGSTGNAKATRGGKLLDGLFHAAKQAAQGVVP
jgi:outer membrane protein assembly factor BamB